MRVGRSGAHHSCAPPVPSPQPLSRRERGSTSSYAQTLRLFLNLQGGVLLPAGARGEGTRMCPALRSEEGGGSRMRVRAKRCASLLRSARTLTPTPLPGGEGLRVAARPNVAIAFLNLQGGILLPPGEGGGSRMRVRAKRCASLLRSARTLTPASPGGEGLYMSPYASLLPERALGFSAGSTAAAPGRYRSIAAAVFHAWSSRPGRPGSASPRPGSAACSCRCPGP